MTTTLMTSGVTEETPLGATLRKEGRTQKWLAGRVGMHEAKLSRIVRGKQEPALGEANDIARALGLPIANVWGLDEGPLI